ncbi:MAG: hypothetical protein GWN00_01080 [Aliifodinibius sp.]|nr:hypothetical protein [Fodinibius sp.]NIV09924.1 hypothetical protein [Fodinibius sp.]NIY23454.1 hypothetical protein [Fodinibius sp.]
MKRINDTDGNLVEVVAELRVETEKAYQILCGTVLCWIPKSLVEQMDIRPDNKSYDMVFPEWLAEEKGLI